MFLLRGLLQGAEYGGMQSSVGFGPQVFVLGECKILASQRLPSFGFR